MAKSQRYAVTAPSFQGREPYFLRSRNVREEVEDCGSPESAGVKGRGYGTLKSPVQDAGQRTKRSSVGNICEGDRSVQAHISSSVKINPLLLNSVLTPPHHATSHHSKEPNENLAFYGQRTKIRRTKEQEMITAIMSLAKYGESNIGPSKRKKWSLLQKAKSMGKRARQLKSPPPKKPSGPFFLVRRRRPLRSRSQAVNINSPDYTST